MEKTSVVVLPLRKKNISKLIEILSEHVVDEKTGKVLWEEINEIKDCMSGQLDVYGRARKYFVAKNEGGEVLGSMAYSEPNPDMLSHFKMTPRESAELSNAFVSSSVFRGQGVGRQILETIFDVARKSGKKYLLVRSRPRYKKSWGFYDKMFDEDWGFLKDSSGTNRKTWRKRL